MKILSLTTFVICLICALSLKVESFENEVNEVNGGFKKSCKSWKLSGTNLFAECKNKKNKYVKTNLSLASCVTNKNGKLAVGADFHKSSKGCTLDKKVNLKCQSKNTKNKYVKSSINVDSFVTNNNGVLTCANSRGVVEQKNNSYAKSCSKAKFDKKKFTLSASCKTGKKNKSVKSVLNLGKCLGNNNGALEKGKDFNKSSKSCSITGTTLSCESKDKKGKYKKTSLDLNFLVANLKGKLSC